MAVGLFPVRTAWDADIQNVEELAELLENKVGTWRPPFMIRRQLGQDLDSEADDNTAADTGTGRCPFHMCVRACVRACVCVCVRACVCVCAVTFSAPKAHHVGVVTSFACLFVSLRRSWWLPRARHVQARLSPRPTRNAAGLPPSLSLSLSLSVSLW